METIDALLSPPVLFGLVAAASLVLVARAVMNALAQLPSLRMQLNTVKKLLSSAHDGIPQKRTEINELQESVKPLKEAVKRLQDYNMDLIDVERQAMREEEELKRQQDVIIPRAAPPGDFYLLHHPYSSNRFTTSQTTGAKSMLSRTEAAYCPAALSASTMPRASATP